MISDFEANRVESKTSLLYTFRNEFLQSEVEMAKAKWLFFTFLAACVFAVPAAAQSGPESADAAFARAIELHTKRPGVC
jgi:hypothetical protein